MKEIFNFSIADCPDGPAYALWVQIAYIPIMVEGAQCAVPVFFLHAGYEECIQLVGARALWENTGECIEQELESLINSGLEVSASPLVVLPYDEEELLKSVQSVFPQAILQIDQQDFVEKILYLIPESYKEDTQAFFDALYAYEDRDKAFELGENLIDYLLLHKLDQAAQALKETADLNAIMKVILSKFSE